MRALLLSVLLATTARAAPSSEPRANAQLAFLLEHQDFVYSRMHDDDPKTDEYPEGGKTAPEQFRFDLGNQASDASGYDRLYHTKTSDYYDTYETSDLVYAVARDGSAAWLSTTVIDRYGCFDGIPGQKCDIHQRELATMLVQLGSSVRPIASHIAVVTDSGKTEPPFELPDDALSPAAKAVAETFRKSIGTPAALVKTVSNRDDVVLLGSAPKERFVGGAAVRAQLAKWNLAFHVRDHVAAGLASKSVAWVAANLDTPKQGSYRALFVYELTGTAWQLVQASFSLPLAP